MKVNMIITYHSMPEMSRYDLLKNIKESDRLKDIPVVIMSSENIPSRITRCLSPICWGPNSKTFVSRASQIGVIMLETYAKAVCEITICVNWELSFMRFQDSSKGHGLMNRVLDMGIRTRSKFELGHFEHDSDMV